MYDKYFFSSIFVDKMTGTCSYRLHYILLTVLLATLFMAEMVFGSISIPLHQLYHALFHPQEGGLASKILWSLRLPRACTALLSGAALSVCGVQMQTLFRNPLADPYVLGISSGAGLGVAFFVMGFSAGVFSGVLGDTVFEGDRGETGYSPP